MFITSQNGYPEVVPSLCRAGVEKDKAKQKAVAHMSNLLLSQEWSSKAL